jgi:signal recognition particle subunit SEC65
MADLKKELAAAKIPAKDLEKILSKLGYKTEVNKIANGF